MLHTDETLLPPAWQKAYRRFCVAPQMKSDFLRFSALRRYGGIYFDVDVTIRVSIDSVVAAIGDGFCAVTLDPRPFIGSDILTCPLNWSGWSAVDDYIEKASAMDAVPFLHFAHSMLVMLARARLCRILPGGRLFPSRRQDYSPHSLVCRGFECSAGEPSVFQKAANFAKSATRHVAAGMPQASEDEVARRFAICEACEHFDGRACKQCGCPVVREKKFLSKLSWANEKCPVGKWGPAAAS